MSAVLEELTRLTQAFNACIADRLRGAFKFSTKDNIFLLFQCGQPESAEDNSGDNVVVQDRVLIPALVLTEIANQAGRYLSGLVDKGIIQPPTRSCTITEDPEGRVTAAVMLEKRVVEASAGYGWELWVQYLLVTFGGSIAFRHVETPDGVIVGWWDNFAQVSCAGLMSLWPSLQNKPPKRYGGNLQRDKRASSNFFQISVQ